MKALRALGGIYTITKRETARLSTLLRKKLLREAALNAQAENAEAIQ